MRNTQKGGKGPLSRPRARDDPFAQGSIWIFQAAVAAEGGRGKGGGRGESQRHRKESRGPSEAAAPVLEAPYIYFRGLKLALRKTLRLKISVGVPTCQAAATVPLVFNPAVCTALWTGGLT